MKLLYTVSNNCPILNNITSLVQMLTGWTTLHRSVSLSYEQNICLIYWFFLSLTLCLINNLLYLLLLLLLLMASLDSSPSAVWHLSTVDLLFFIFCDLHLLLHSRGSIYSLSILVLGLWKSVREVYNNLESIFTRSSTDSLPIIPICEGTHCTLYMKIKCFRSLNSLGTSEFSRYIKKNWLIFNDNIASYDF